MATDLIIFDPQDQGAIAAASAKLFDTHKGTFPKIPWLSHKGQQDAFLATVGLIGDAAGGLTTDKRAKDAITFWTLAITYANVKMYRVATTAIKRDNWMINDWTAGRTFVDWAGSEMHPAEAVRAAIDKWRG